MLKLYNVLKTVKLNAHRVQVIRLASGDVTTRRPADASDIEKKQQQQQQNDDEKEKEEQKKRYERYKARRGHEKYFRDEERKMSLIDFHDEFFEKNVLRKDAKTFIAAIEAFDKTNKNRQLYIDFVYGAVPRMKEYGAHRDINAYKKLLDLFPMGPLVMQNTWQRDMMHYPRHQNCVIYLLENMEDNFLQPDTEMYHKVISIFGDWTHAVKKVRRMLYWMPKFKYANRYANPFLPELTDQLDLSIAAIERMTSVDVETKIRVNLTKEIDGDQEDTWIAWAQSTKQKALLRAHDQSKPIYVEGPFLIWMQRKQVEYFVLKSEEYRIIDDFKRDDDNFEQLENIFMKYIEKDKSKQSKKRTVHEQNDGTIYAICCTGTGTKNSIITWTKILQQSNEILKNLAIVYKVKDKNDELINNNNNTSNTN